MNNKLTAIISEILEVDQAEIGPDFDQSSTANWDSLNHLNLTIAIEEAFDVSFEPEEIATMISLKAIEEKLNEKLNA